MDRSSNQFENLFRLLNQESILNSPVNPNQINMIPTMIYPGKLRTLVENIEEQGHLTSEFLLQLIPSLNLLAEDFSELADFNHLKHYSYGRTKLYKGTNFVIFLMSWAKNDFTAIHNHGQADCGAVYFLGEVNHRSYQVENNHLLLTGHSIIPTGTVVPVPGALVHAMGNLSDQPSLSLHIYGFNHPSETTDTTTRIFELEKKRVRFTSGEAFLDGHESFGKPSIDVTTNEETLVDYLKIILPYYEMNHKPAMVKQIKAILQDPSSYFRK